MVYAGKLDEYKGGLFLAETINKRFITDKEIVFVIVGNTAGEYGKKVEQRFADSENRILRFPTQKYVDLAQFFQAADIAVFAKECSLTFFDVQACGLPVVSEDNIVNVERCKFNNGVNFKKGDIDDFRMKILNMAELPKDEYRKISEAGLNYVVKYYNYEDKARQFEKLMSDEVERQRKIKRQ